MEGERFQPGMSVPEVNPGPNIDQFIDRLTAPHTKTEEFFFVGELDKLSREAFKPEIVQTMFDKHKAHFERVLARLSLREENVEGLDPVFAKILTKGTGDELARNLLARYFAQHRPGDDLISERLERYGLRHLKKRRQNSTDQGLLLGYLGRYEKMNQYLKKSLFDERINDGYRSVILANAHNLLTQSELQDFDWSPFITHSSPALRETSLKYWLAHNQELPAEAKQLFLEDPDPFITKKAKEYFEGTEPFELSPMTEKQRDRWRGAFFGHAVGDSLGAPIETMTLEEIREQFGVVDRLVDFSGNAFPSGEYTDDTDLVLMQLEILAKKQRIDPWTLSSVFSQKINRHDRGADINRHYGARTLLAMRRLAIGMNWRATGNYSNHNGAAIRVLPILLMDHEDSEKAVITVGDLAKITHTDSLAAQGAQLLAAAIARAIRTDTLEPGSFLQHIKEGVSHPELLEKLDILKDMLEQGATPAEAQAKIGTTSNCSESVIYALYSFLRTPDNFLEAVSTAINVDGDSDSTGAMCGSLVGAYKGERAIPAELLTQITATKPINRLLGSLGM